MVAAGKYSQFGSSTVLVNEDISKWNGKRVVKDHKVYRLEINPGQSETITQYKTGNDSQVVSWMTSVASKIRYLDYNTDNPSRNKIRFDYRGKAFQIVAREVLLDETVTYNFPVSANRNDCIDATYDMFAMPVDPKVFGLTVESDPVVVLSQDGSSNDQVFELTTVSDMQLAIATLLGTKLGANSENSLIYDLQLLPYCPIEDLNIYFENTIYGPTYGKWVLDVKNLSSKDYTLIYNNETTPDVRGIVFYPKHANFSTLVEYSIPNDTVHYEYQEVVDPIFQAQGQRDGLTLWRFANFPYKVTDGV